MRRIARSWGSSQPDGRCAGGGRDDGPGTEFLVTAWVTNMSFWVYLSMFCSYLKLFWGWCTRDDLRSDGRKIRRFVWGLWRMVLRARCFDLIHWIIFLVWGRAGFSLVTSASKQLHQSYSKLMLGGFSESPPLYPLVRCPWNSLWKQEESDVDLDASVSEVEMVLMVVFSCWWICCRVFTQDCFHTLVGISCL